MMNKELADRLRKLIDATSNGMVLSEALQTIADELDPPRLVVFEDGTLGFVLRSHTSVDRKWDIVTEYGELLTFDEAMTFKPAHVLAPDEVAVKIPPTHGWGHRITDVEIRLYYWDVDTIDHADPVQLIPRAEAERMEARDDA